MKTSAVALLRFQSSAPLPSPSRHQSESCAETGITRKSGSIRTVVLRPQSSCNTCNVSFSPSIDPIIKQMLGELSLRTVETKHDRPLEPGGYAPLAFADNPQTKQGSAPVMSRKRTRSRSEDSIVVPTKIQPLNVVSFACYSGCQYVQRHMSCVR